MTLTAPTETHVEATSGAPAAHAIRPPGHDRRWATLAIVCLAVFVTVLDGTIVNIALPSLATDLDATTGSCSGSSTPTSSSSPACSWPPAGSATSTAANGR